MFRATHNFLTKYRPNWKIPAYFWPKHNHTADNVWRFGNLNNHLIPKLLTEWRDCNEFHYFGSEAKSQLTQLSQLR